MSSRPSKICKNKPLLLTYSIVSLYNSMAANIFSLQHVFAWLKDYVNPKTPIIIVG